MKLFFSATSPYVRKCLVAAHELGLSDRIELLASNAGPVDRDAGVVAVNPLGKVPTLVTDDGASLYDSRVICEYLDALGGGKLFPRDGDARWNALTLQSLGDGLMDALLITRYEQTLRPEAMRWPAWTDGQLDKVTTTLEALEPLADALEGRLDIGTISLGCALWYLDLRFANVEWRGRFPKVARWAAAFSQRPSMKATWSA